MRYLLFTFTLFQAYISVGQTAHLDKSFPFQVLFAENVTNKSGKDVRSLDMISIDDTLAVKEDGTLAFVHYTGYPIEVSGDTVLVVKYLNGLILESENNSKKKDPELAERPNLEYLFISSNLDARNYRKKRGNISAGCHDCDNHDLQILYPPKLTKNGSVITTYKSNFRISWLPTNSRKYEVTVQTMFDEIIKEYSTSNNTIIIDGAEISRLSGGQENLIVQIEDENRRWSTNVLKEFKSNKIEFPYSCDIKNASLALLTGFYAEQNFVNSLEEAGKYFVLATTLSDKAFYKEMLDNFRKRIRP